MTYQITLVVTQLIKTKIVQAILQTIECYPVTRRCVRWAHSMQFDLATNIAWGCLACKMTCRSMTVNITACLLRPLRRGSSGHKRLGIF